STPPPRGPTGDLHDVVLGLDHQLLGGEVVDIQGDLPAVGALADFGDAAAELAAQRPAVGRARRRHQGAFPGQQTEIPGPGAAARPLVPILGDVGHPEGLVEEAAAVVPVAEGLPAGAAEEGEGHAALSHDARGPWCWEGAGGAGPYEAVPLVIFSREAQLAINGNRSRAREGTRSFPRPCAAVLGAPRPHTPAAGARLLGG
uniref:Uncharacterized protein n=1 Tax=Anas platyrhynchos platyrhynchos TaxID=8840 RepID=A0A493T5M1_ANAPP